MEPQNINITQNDGERVTSTYAEIYCHETYCDPELSKDNILKFKHIHNEESKDEWISPSDLLIGIIELKPPFTSKITRGKTHEGILAIGNAVLETERAKFLKSLKGLLEENDSSWNHILIHEKQEVIKKVKAIFLNIYTWKSDIMKKEISNFYEKTLQDLEEYLRFEIQTVLESVHSNIVSELNNQIHQKLKKERKILESVLFKKYLTEVQKMKKYYKLLLDNELSRNNKLINKALFERNNALKAFYNQIEAQRLTSTMYVMSLERKKCEIKKMLLENIQNTEVTEKMQKIKQKMNEIESYEQQDIGISNINKQWQEKIRKILHLFLKFISFSLKLLPEQSMFLLDLEKMVVLQLNKIQKNSNIATTVLLEEDQQLNVFQFLDSRAEQEPLVCEKEPFVVVGDLSDPIPTRYGSQETLPSHVDLPFLRLDRQYMYAKCHGFEDIQKFLDSQICKCNLPTQKSLPKMVTETTEYKPVFKSVLKESESSIESFLIDDFSRLYECPARKCYNWTQRNSFPNLPSYLEYNEENFQRVTTILKEVPKKDAPPKLISAKDIAYSELPFSETKELYHTAGTQYSSQDDLTVPVNICPCIDNTLVKHSESHYRLKTSSSQAINEILLKRKISLQRLMENNPNLHKIFTDEYFDYKI